MLKGLCIGAGYFSKFHFEAWNRMNDVEIIGIFDLDYKKAKEAAESFQLGIAVEDLDLFLEQEKIDFVDIITPPSTHLELVRKALDKGIAIICQKPLAPTYDEALELRDLVKNSKGSRFMVHENWRFQPWYREIKSLLIDEEIVSLSFRMRTGDGWQENAYLERQPYFRSMERFLIHETGIHFIDTFRYLAGEISAIFAKFKQLNPEINGEDFAWVHFDFTSGAVGLLDANRYLESTAENPRFTFGNMWVETRKKAVKLLDDGRIFIHDLGKREKEHRYNFVDRGFAGDCVFATQKHFINCLTLGHPFETNIDDYMLNLKIEECIYRSAWENRLVQIDEEES